jgi:hypothetical protein
MICPSRRSGYGARYGLRSRVNRNPTLFRGGSGDESLQPRAMRQYLEGHPQSPQVMFGAVGAFE